MMSRTHEGAPRAGTGALAGAARGPELDFAVESAGVVEFAAAPTLRFTLRITSRGGETIRNVLLSTQLRIAAAKRSYDPATQARLVELFGEPHRWGSTVHSLFWTQVTLLVPPFTGRTLVDLPVPCTYDLDIAAARYFHGVLGGEVPLELFFSGTIFYTGESGALQAARIALDREATFRLPVRVWKEMMAHYFPNSAWLRLDQDALERLHAYRARHALATWDDAVNALLGSAERAPGG
jgi:hypothetical protein